MLDWNDAAEFTHEGREGGLAIALHHGHVEFSIVPDPDGFHVEVHIDGVTVYSDDNYKAPDRDAGKRRAEGIYERQAAAWCNADMLAEILERNKA